MPRYGIMAQIGQLRLAFTTYYSVTSYSTGAESEMLSRKWQPFKVANLEQAVWNVQVVGQAT